MGENWIISKSYRNRVTSLKQETKENQEMHVWHIYWNTALKISNQNMTLHVTEVSAYKTLEECQILELLVYLHTQKDSRTKICDLCGFFGQVWPDFCWACLTCDVSEWSFRTLHSLKMHRVYSPLWPSRVWFMDRLLGAARPFTFTSFPERFYRNGNKYLMVQ